MRYILPIIYLLFLCTFNSCKNTAEVDEATYFGGEIINPTKRHVLLFKDETLVDSIPLDDNNRFLYKFNNLKPGLYNFTHTEYQYFYIEPQDSIMLRLNTIEFDESLTYTGKGANKNNFFIKTFLMNEESEEHLHDLFKQPPKKFSKIIRGELKQRLENLERYQNKYGFPDDFYDIAETQIKLHYYAQKEYYARYSKKYIDSINPKEFYDYRGNIDFDNQDMIQFVPYSDYMYALSDNISANRLHQKGITPKDESYNINYNITKIETIDSLFSSEVLKNTLYKRTALHYLSKIKCKTNANKFLAVFNEHNSDEKNKEAIEKIVRSIEGLQRGNYIPNFNVINLNKDTTSIKKIINRPTVIYFWTTRYPRHIRSVHEKVRTYSENSNYNFIGLSIDNNVNVWSKVAQKYNPDNEYIFVNHKDASENLFIHNIGKIFILDSEGKILSSDLNMFDPKFEKKLKALE